MTDKDQLGKEAARPTSASVDGVTLRRFPFPYKAALTICSDIDDTKTVERFVGIQNFLNVTEDTGMGPGLGLEIGNTFFPYTPDDSFGYFSSRSTDRQVIETLIKAGYIDCIHSYGDGATSRADALRALEAFEQSGSKVDIWIDHSHAPTNFGKDTTPGEGDVKGSPLYHADATMAYGIKFVWKGRGSSIVAQDVPLTPASFWRVFDAAHPRETLMSIAKEAAKLALAYTGNERFAIHKGNPLMHIAHLADGTPVYEFNRCNPYWQGQSYGHNSYGLAYVLREKVLRDLIRLKGYMIVYTHIGFGSEQPPYLPEDTRAALRGLAAAYRRGDIYITTTSRLLHYYFNHRYLQWSARRENGSVRIVIDAVEDPLNGRHVPTVEELQGITFYVPDRSRAEVFIGTQPVTGLERNPADDSGRESVMIPRTHLTYPLAAVQALVPSVVPVA